MGSPIFDALWNDTLSRRDPELQALMTSTTGALGADVSNWQNVVSWAPFAASGRSFVFVKAGEGNSTSYPTLDAQYQGAVNAGLTVGLYHFAITNLTPEQNADAFAAQLNRLGAINGHLPPALDLEEGSGNLSGWAQRFVARLRQQTGCQRVFVYSDISFMTHNIFENWMDDDVLIWIADPSAPPGKPRYSSPRVAIHQYSQSGQVPGVSCDVDLNIALRPLDQLIVGDSDMTPEQAQQLDTLTQQVDDIHQQLLGLYNAWAGGKTDANNTAYTLLQLVLRNNVEIVQAGLIADEIKSAIAVLNVAPGPDGQLSSADAQLIAEQVVAEFSSKLGAPGV